jgi:hypothetical protein
MLRVETSDIGAGAWGKTSRGPFVLGKDMATSKQPVLLQVELTQYGWSLKEDATPHELFISKDKAVNRLKERQKALKAGGRTSDVVITNQQDAPRGGQAKWRTRGPV